ncbi:enoyl-CoA hydratase/isomerase family protein [Bacteriovorax sp. DB6_IX]|nr:enoyl-CoA hydratase-related protein [Bacteriovorax sp. DB6_IX]EQC52490.1 enoyl-CoA hydratase/isomerase family protein [Bacteriovorax sp. DB6_IX]
MTPSVYPKENGIPKIFRILIKGSGHGWKMENIIVDYSFKDNEHVALIKLNRPKVLNALTTDLIKELVETLYKIEDDPKIRCTILTGNDKAFAAGADIAQMVEATAIDQLQSERYRYLQQFNLLTKPIIAAVNGFALGGGCELAMMCDLIIAGDSAKFGQPEIKIGTIPGAGGSQRLTRAIGKSKAMMLALTGDMINARQADEWGLVAKVVPSMTLLDEAYQLAKTISQRAPVAVQLCKQSVNKAYEMSLSDALDYERRSYYLTFSSEDQKEGMRAFLEKRAPEYKGK